MKMVVACGRFRPWRWGGADVPLPSAFPSWLPVVDKLRTLDEFDPETVELLTL
jgi:hypothetical protein